VKHYKDIYNDMPVVAKILLGIYVLVGLMMSVVGFAIHTVINNADTNIHYDHVYTVKQAYISESDLLYVCVDGKYSEKKREYWIRVPVKDIEKTPGKLDGVHGYSSYWKESYHQQWHIPRENIVVADCSNKPSVEKRPVKIEVIDARMTGSYMTEDILNEHFELSSEKELVYQLNVTDGAAKPIKRRDLAYANKATQFEDKHAFMFETIYYRQRGSVLWYLVLPFAWALDIIAWPIELFMWVEYAGAH
jgi:hypothetical protein